MTTKNIQLGLAFVFICFLWGSTWVSIRWGLESLTPFFFAGFRFIVAAIALYIIMRLRNMELALDKQSIEVYIVMGLFSFVIPFGLVYWGTQFISAGLGAILFGVFPFFVAIFSHIFIPNEKIRIYKFSGIIIGFIGIVIIYADGININLKDGVMGMSAIILSACMQGAISVYLKKRVHRMNPLSINFVPLVIAGIIMTIVGYLFEDRSAWVFDEKAIYTTLYLAIFGTIITFTIYFWLMKQISVVFLSMATFVIPIFAALLGWLILNETLTAKTLLGSSLVLIGILFANLRGLINYYKNKKLAVNG